jgi:hypothetical protein
MNDRGLDLELAHTQELIEYVLWLYATDNIGYEGVEHL